MDIRSWFLRYSWGVNLALLAMLAFFSAGTINMLLADSLRGNTDAGAAARPLASLNTQPAYQPPYNAILQRDLFQTKPKIEEVADGGTAGEDTVAETSLRLKLIGIAFFGTDSAGNLATITKLAEQKTEVFRKGDQVTEGAVVDSVLVDRVILARGDRREELLFTDKDEKPGRRGGFREERMAGIDQAPRPSGEDLVVRQKSATEFEIPQATIQSALANMNDIMTKARVIPNFTGQGENRVIDGFRIFRIQPGSIFKSLGLNDGDVIRTINGGKLDSMTTALEALQALKTQTQFTIELERQRNPVTFSYEVTQ